MKRLFTFLALFAFLFFLNPLYADETYLDGVLQGGGSGSVEDDAYGAGWNGDTTNAPSQNAAYDMMHTYDTDDDGDIDEVDGVIGGGDVTAGGPGCASGDCWTDGVVTTGTSLIVWEGTTDNDNEMTFIVPEDPGADINITFPTATGTLLTTAGVGTNLTALNGENIQDDTIDDDSIDFSDVTLDDLVSAEGDYISVASDDTFDFTRNDSGTVTITASDDDADAALTVVAGGTGALTLGGASNTSITATTDGGSITLDGLIGIGADPADSGVIRLENATGIYWEDGTEAYLLHVDETGLKTNLGFQVLGTLDADGIVALGDGGDNFSVASDGIDIDTSGNITNAGTIGCGKVTSSAAFESATGLFDRTGADAITVGSADVTVITLQTDDTGDGTDLVVPAQSINGSEMLNNTVTATQLSAALTMADGDLLDFNGVVYVNANAANEGIAIPPYIAGAAPASGHHFLAWDASNNYLWVYESGGWVNASQGTGASTSLNYVTTQAEGDLSTESVVTAGYGMDVTDAGGDGGALTFAVDTTEISADGSDTWSDGTQASIAWTFDVSGTDHTMTAGDGLMTFGDAVTVTDTLTASNGIALGASKSITGTTAMTLGAGTETVAINSSDWDIDATGIATNMGNITSDGVVTATGFTIGSAAITETELEILDGATLSTTQINYLASATGTTGTSNTNVVFSASPTFTGTVGAAGITATGTVQAEQLTTTDDASVGDDLALGSDGAILRLGADGDATDAIFTHVADLGVNFNDAISIADDQFIAFGGSLSGYDWKAGYDEASSDALEFTHTAGAGADVTWDLNDNAADSTYTITNSDGTYVANLSVEGSITSTSSGDSYLALANNSGGYTASSGYAIYVDAGTWKYYDGSEHAIVHEGISATWTGTTHDFTSVTNVLLPSAADASSEIGIDTTGHQLEWHDGGRACTIDMDNDSSGYVLKSDGSGNLTLQADETGGTPAWSTVGDPSGDTTIDHDAGEETNFTFTGAFTTGTQFLVQQLTGNPSGGTLFGVNAADSDVSPFRVTHAGEDFTIAYSASNTMAFGSSTSVDYIIGLASYALGSAGVKLTGDGDGALTILGLGNGSDEDLTFNFDDTADEVTVSSSTSVGTVDFGTINLETDVIEADTDVQIGSDPADQGAVRLDNAAVIAWEDATECTLTHVDNTGLACNLQIQAATLTDGTASINSGAVSGVTTLTAGTSVITPLLDAAGDEDMDYGSADVDDHTFTSDGGTVIIDGTISSSGNVTIGDNSDADYVLTFNADASDLTATWMVDEEELRLASDTGEDLTIDLNTATDNEVGISTQTGVTQINFGAISLLTTGSVQGAVTINSDADGMSQGEMTAVGMYGTMFFATGAGTWNLPAAAAGMSFCLYSTGASAIIINPDDADTITYDGVKDTAGHQIASPSAAGDFISMVALDGTDWYVLGHSGTWVPGS